MKNRILLLIWFILLALAAIFTGAWVYAVLLLLSALAVVAFLQLGFFCGKKITMKLKLPKAAEQDGIWKGKLQIVNDSVLPVFLGKGSLHLENHFTGEKMELPFSFSLKGKGKKAIDFQGKSQWCGCIYATLHTWRSYDFFGLAGQKRKAGLSACTVVMPCEQKEDFQFLTKEGFDMESFRYSGARPGDDPGETFDIREYQEGDSIRQIHWKLTGKLDKMMIRQRSFPVDDTVLILAEAFQADRDPQRAETVAEVFSAVLQSFMEQKISCQAGIYDRSSGKFRLEKIRTEEDRENILYRFLRYGSDVKTPVTVQEYLKDPGTQNFANYVYITGDPQDKEAELLAAKGEVTIVGCGTGGRDSGGEQVLWKYGSQNPKDSQKQHMENNCPVSCWKLH